MARQCSDVVLFTLAFPYDGSESVLREEVEVLARKFDRIFIVPSSIGTESESLPGNVRIVDLGWGRGFSRRDRRRALFSRAATIVLVTTLRHPRDWRPYARGLRWFLDILAINIVRSSAIATWVRQNGLEQALYYDYWFENSTLALALLRRSGVIRAGVSRAHRFDVFDESWDRLQRVPFREFKARHLDAVFAVSEDAARYLRSKLGVNAHKVTVARLGVIPPASVPSGRPDPPTVVSCSALIPRKRVHLIPDALLQTGQRLHWVHFGDGPERARVEEAADRLPDDITWELRGWVDNDAVRDYYRSHPVSAFVSLSASEGIPVSMMEAQSYGIPIVSVDVGGVAELVTPDCGILASADADLPVLAQAIRDVLSARRFDPARIRALFSDRYDAVRNYEQFAEALFALCSSVEP